MPELITWKNIGAPSVAAELAEARKAQEGIGAAFNSLGGRVEDYAAGKQKRQTDAFIADLNAAADDEARQKMISEAESGWLNMERVTGAARDATKFGMEKELHKDEIDTNLAEREFRKNTLAEQIRANQSKETAAASAALTQSFQFDKTYGLDIKKSEIDLKVAQKALDESASTIKRQDQLYTQEGDQYTLNKPVNRAKRKADLETYHKTARTAANLEIFNEFESKIADLPSGSKESTAAIKKLKDRVTGPIKDGIGGMDLTTFNNKIRPHREANLAASVGFGDESYQKILDYGFVPNPVNELGQPLDRPPLAAFTSYEAMLTRTLKNDPQNKGMSRAAIQAKVNQILNTPEYIAGKRAATQIQASIDKVEDVREITQSKIAQDNEDFHVEVKNSTAANHIIALLDKNFPQNYSRKKITEEQLRSKIQTTLDRVNKLYGATTPKVKSAYARAVYKLFSMSQAENDGNFIIPGVDIIGADGTQGEIMFGGKTSARTLGMIDLSLEKLPNNALSQALSPHLLTRHQDTAAAKKEAVEKALSGKKEKKTEEQILLDRLKLPKQEHQINRYKKEFLKRQNSGN